jgi:excisionase family DNA binding protein
MITDLKLGEKRAPAIALEGQPLSLADRIERFGRAMTATQLASILAVSRIAIYKYAKVGRIPCFKIGTSVRFCPKPVADWLRGQ